MTTGDGTGTDRVQVWTTAFVSGLDIRCQQSDDVLETQKRIEELKQVKSIIAEDNLYEHIRVRGKRYQAETGLEFRVRFMGPTEWREPRSIDGIQRNFLALIEGKDVLRFFEVTDPVETDDGPKDVGEAPSSVS